jgi:predicted RNase H-like HicB family nuclease
MRYPIAIEPGTDATAFGVVIPDLPGCFSVRDTLDEVDATLDAGRAIPAPGSLDMLRRNPAYARWTFGVVTPT